jgi:hypothetical protein
MTGDERDAVERILEDGLAAYSSQESLAGMEQRVMGRIAGTRAGRRFAFGRWAVLIPLAACLVVAALVWMRPRPNHPRVAKVASVRPPASGATEIPAQRVPARVAPRKVRRPRLPKLPDFPQRTPVTPQERALLALAADAPEQLRSAFGDSNMHSLDPIPLSEIKIQPLNGNDTQ